LYRNKSPELSFQFAAVLSLWFLWLSTAIIVVWQERELRGPPLYINFPYSRVVFSLVFLAMPLVPVAFGIVLLRSVPTDELSPSQRVLYYVVGTLTILAIMFLLLILVLICGHWAVGSLNQVRE